MTRDISPAARALVALELIHNNPGITAQRLADRLGVTERAARRYVAILREADLPIESVSGPYGGYRVGRGLRLSPLMFTAAEALGLVMAVLEGHPKAADPANPVGGALAPGARWGPDAAARDHRRSGLVRAAARQDPGAVRRSWIGGAAARHLGPKHAATAGGRGPRRRRGRVGSAQCLRHRGHLGRVPAR